ncbi:acyl carrier protein [Cellulomonas sp. URHB0016]
MFDAEQIKQTVVGEMSRLLVEEGSGHGTITDSDGLMDMGLDSLAFAVLITRLETSLGYDPFMAIEQGAPPRTVGELVDFYVAHQE